MCALHVCRYPQAQNADNCELPNKGLGTELRFSGRPASALSHRVSSPASTWMVSFNSTSDFLFLICDPAVDMVYMYFCITIFSCISIFLLPLRYYSQKKDNLRALMIFQKNLHLPVARCKSRGVTILLPVYDSLPFLTSRLVWNFIILCFRSSVENFES